MASPVHVKHPGSLENKEKEPSRPQPSGFAPHHMRGDVAKMGNRHDRATKTKTFKNLEERKVGRKRTAAS